MSTKLERIGTKNKRFIDNAKKKLRAKPIGRRKGTDARASNKSSGPKFHGA